MTGHISTNTFNLKEQTARVDAALKGMGLDLRTKDPSLKATIYLLLAETTRDSSIARAALCLWEHMLQMQAMPCAPDHRARIAAIAANMGKPEAVRKAADAALRANDRLVPPSDLRPSQGSRLNRHFRFTSKMLVQLRILAVAAPSKAKRVCNVMRGTAHQR